MVVEPTMFIVGDEQGRLIPLRARSKSLIYLLYKPLSSGYVVGGVVVVGRGELYVEVVLLDDDVIGQAAQLSVLLEGEFVAVEFGKVFELAQALVEKHGGNVLVVDAKAEPFLVKRIEDGLLGEAMDEVPAHVAGGTVGCGRVDIEAVGLGGGRDGGEPLIEHGKVLR